MYKTRYYIKRTGLLSFKLRTAITPSESESLSDDGYIEINENEYKLILNIIKQS